MQPFKKATVCVNNAVRAPVLLAQLHGWAWCEATLLQVLLVLCCLASFSFLSSVLSIVQILYNKEKVETAPANES